MGTKYSDITTEKRQEQIETAVESLETNAFDSATDTIIIHLDGTVYNRAVTAAQCTDDAEHAFGTDKLKDVVIYNNHASQTMMIGETQATKALSRSENFPLLAGSSIGFTCVDLAKLFFCTAVDTEEPTLRVIGTVA